MALHSDQTMDQTTDLTTNQAIDTAQTVCLNRWNTPFPSFTSGQDIRTSDNGLLVLTYGNLLHSASLEWLNAGRSLIDKTYISMLRHVQSLTNIRTFNPETIARELDSFIKTEIRPVWDLLPQLDDSQKNKLACDLVEKAAQRLFGSLQSEVVASRILFFLCPMLPIFNYGLDTVEDLNQLGQSKGAFNVETLSYVQFHKAMSAEYQQIKEALNQLPLPVPEYGNPHDQHIIKSMLEETDWWSRRVLDELHMATNDGKL